jgi:tryptophan synthase alpha chain
MRRRLVVYFPLADPAVPTELIDLYADAGVDVVECGWPARNPYLDGPDVRASMARALSGAPATALAAARDRLARKSGAKALVMT